MVFLVLFIIAAVVLFILGHLILDYMAILEEIEPIHRKYSDKQTSLARAKKSQNLDSNVLTTQK